ncbi:MAG: ABC transporter permease subunit [Thermoanaerobaculia bacterium]
MKAALLIARREIQLLRRSRATHGSVVLLTALAWTPAVLLPLRSGSLGLSAFADMLPLQIALSGVVLPLLALLAGAELLAGEIEDGSLIPSLTLPLSRRTCLAGKCLGRSSILALAYLIAFATVGVAVAMNRGIDSWRDWAAVTLAGLLLSLATGGIGIALGASGKGRVRVFGAALIAWIVLVFALDGLLLAGLVALAPAPPTEVGKHGHTELAAPRQPAPSGRSLQSKDPHARHSEAEAEPMTTPSTWILALNPVSLFRVTALTASPVLRPRVGLSFPNSRPRELLSTIALGWLVWLVLPLGAAFYRFQRTDLF